MVPVLDPNSEEGQRSHNTLLSLSPTKGAVLSSLQEDSPACTPEFSMWPPSPVTHAGSVRNLCLKMLNVKKGRAEADSTTEIGPWRQRRSKSSFCTKLSAKDPKTWVGERGRRGLHAMPCIRPAEPLQLLLDPEPGKNPEPRRWVPEPRLPRFTLHIGLPMT